MIIIIELKCGHTTSFLDYMQYHHHGDDPEIMYLCGSCGAFTTIDGYSFETYDEDDPSLKEI